MQNSVLLVNGGFLVFIAAFKRGLQRQILAVLVLKVIEMRRFHGFEIDLQLLVI
ncbi:MAG: hypothetical protein IPJ88_17570 [Myxococcales bacterium]|nr:MAG: hypothetical protein IPJ88_17570 [Myxococcales bacterium]